MVPGRVTSAPSRSLLRARGEEVRAPALTAPGASREPGRLSASCGDAHPEGFPPAWGAGTRALGRERRPRTCPSETALATSTDAFLQLLPSRTRVASPLTAVGGGSADSLVPVPLAPRSGPWDGGCSAHPSLCAKPLAPADPRVVWLLAKGHNKWQQLRLGERRGEPGAVEEWVRRLRARARCTALKAGRRGFCPHLAPGSLAGPWPAAVRLRWPLTRDDPAVRS